MGRWYFIYASAVELPDDDVGVNYSVIVNFNRKSIADGIWFHFKKVYVTSEKCSYRRPMDIPMGTKRGSLQMDRYIIGNKILGWTHRIYESLFVNPKLRDVVGIYKLKYTRKTLVSWYTWSSNAKGKLIGMVVWKSGILMDVEGLGSNGK